jgi:hypothetical protein
VVFEGGLVHRFLVAAVAALLALPSLTARATTIVRVPDAELVAQAPLVVVARLLDRLPSHGGRAVTVYRWSVERVLQGYDRGVLLVAVPGGPAANGFALRIDGMPRFLPGERAILFLEREGGAHRLLHLMQGAFREVRHGGRSFAVRDLAEVVELRRTAGGIDSAPASAGEPLRDFDAFADWIAEAARGAAPEPDYRVDALAGDRSRGHLAAPFSLFQDFEDGLPMRWFEFDSGGTVLWRISPDGQPGVPGDGQAELIAAIEAWNAESETPVDYDFAGTSTATGGLGCGECFDGLNVVLLDDPNEELSDLGPSCSGTLAYAGPWYLPSTQDFAGQQFHPIVEADVVVNDGLECFFADSPDASKAAEELFAHELGHTLGIDHSEFFEALMRHFIHDDGRGAALHSDDEAALRALYAAPPEPCTEPTIDLSADTVFGVESWTACETITAGNGFHVAAGGVATFTAPTVILGDGFSVADGGELRVVTP